MYRILSLDGGGIRGVLSSTILSRLVAAQPDFLGHVDMIAGTSTGAILGLALAKGLPPDRITQLYREEGPKIFHHDFFGDASHLFGLTGSKYKTEPRLTALKAVLGDVKLQDLPKKVLVPTVKLDSHNPPQPEPAQPAQWKAKLFHNFPGKDSDGDQLALDVAMRSSAAPVYFPIYQGYVDGGLVANDPSTCALVQAMHPSGAGTNQEEIAMLSIGTGGTQEFIDAMNDEWGLEQWNMRLVSLPLSAPEGMADYQSRLLLGSRYFRVQPELTRPIPLDDVASIEELVRIADAFPLNDVLTWLRDHWL